MDYQEHDIKKLQELLERPYWTEEECRWMMEYLEDSDLIALRALMQQQFEAATHPVLSQGQADRLLQQVEAQIDTLPARSRVFPFWQVRRLVVAASVLALTVAGAWLYQHREKSGYRIAAAPPVVTAADVAPGTSSALLTLANGTTIALDEAADGTLAHQGGTRVIKLNGQLSYTQDAETQGPATYNTITTLRGNQYQVVLADGSRVWLNAASSLRVPTTFSRRERKVELSGEAYFEVARDPGRPFKVNSGGMEVAVLGTHFNINAYEDEEILKTTLSHGKVRVSKGSSSVVLGPAQQALLTSGRERLKVQPADVDKELAWKTGVFEFSGDSLPAIMRQIARWYNVDIRFANVQTSRTYNGTISRDASLMQVLQILKLAGVSWSLKGRELTVKG